jgi:hypothetical protein
MDMAIVVFLGSIGRSKKPEKNIVSFELEDGYSND